MALLDNPEHLHIGRQLVAHRDALGVTAGMLERVAGHGDVLDIRWIEQATEPSILRIRRYHWLVIEAYEAQDVKPAVSVGFREQWFTSPRDATLHHQILSGGRRTAWWWNAARTERGAGAFCYVCNTLIHAYDLTRGMTHPARLAVMNHRAGHVAALLGITETRNGRNRT